MTTSLRSLAFDNRFVRELPGDPDTRNMRRQVLGAAWSAVEPTPVANPSLVACATDLAALIGFTESDIQHPDFARVFGGNALMPGMQPYAACYGGHQFGNWAGQLGDGRAITLGETINTAGERWELQLKGAGPTPYSRSADGRAVLRSSIREFLCSEAMHHLGVPTTRALSLVRTGDSVMRDMFYNGNPELEPGAIVCRVAPSFIRFGNFEIFAARNDVDTLTRLVDFTIARDYPHIQGDETTRRVAWLTEIADRTARMIVHWMRVGFVHGVMNTDNMSILGLTIDYGPYGWVDNFDPSWTPNTTDAQGRRYRFGQQPLIAQWNLVRLAEALSLVIRDEAVLQSAIDRYAEVYTAEYDAMNRAKFGLPDASADNAELIREGYALLYDAEMDFTRFFRALGNIPQHVTDFAPEVLLGDVFYDDSKGAAQHERLESWLRTWHAAAHANGQNAEARQTAMHAVNPWFVLRNYVAQQAIDASTAGDDSKVHELLEVLRNPYNEQPGKEHLVARRPEWARHKAGCSMLSCSS
ncbi:MAG: YdiU family protein [Gemmatimonadaceae bacterium]|nr:YdiU family protein [Gemmatimonadaceae bacterium]